MKFTHLMCALAIGALAVSAQTVTPTIVKTTGVVGIADSQTAQFNVLNAGVQTSGVGVVCSATLSFVNSAGKVLKSALVAVPPGQSMNLNLRSDVDLSLLPGDRREIRATISMPAFPPPPNASSTALVPACKLIPTLEIFDTQSGRTLVTLGHAEIVPPAPVTTTP